MIEIVAESAGNWLIIINEQPKIAISIAKSDFKVCGNPLHLYMFLRHQPYETYQKDENYNKIIEVVKQWVKEHEKKINDAIQMYNKLK